MPFQSFVFLVGCFETAAAFVGVPRSSFVDSSLILSNHHHRHLLDVRAAAAPIASPLEFNNLYSAPPTLVLADDPSGILGPGGPLGQVGGDWLEGAGGLLYNVAIGLTFLFFAGAALTYLMASIVVPAAAQKLEEECRELSPELWEEYQAKLGEGETMDQRPDLMRELGKKLQPLLDQKVAMQQHDSAVAAPPEMANGIDATVIKEEKENDA